MTPEGRVKKKITTLLKSYENLYFFMPVPGGLGPSTLDYIICYNGKFIGVEAKAPGKKPTPRQYWMIEQIQKANGYTFVVDGVNGELEKLKQLLDSI